ncbi:TPA: FRG domain-containing protein, partial [Legionella pneumophila]|nr:FRG domain-containing protein [Legionella pneumophila]HAT2113692.1 FRG domain-containing protein [Legionella pneumophila]HAT8721402.1 FRG domain-containing protein [Legionella pneumophila]
MTANIRTIISTLEQLSLEGYVFRGHEDFRYQLTPSAFRTHSIVQMEKDFNIHPTILDEWFNSKEIKKIIASWYSPNSVHLQHPAIYLLKEWCLYIMHYNHSLHLFVKNNPDNVSEQDAASFLLRDAEYWRQETTFQQMFERYLPTIINRRSLKDGAFIQRANPYEELAAVDETLPQHYGIPTAALDWSYNFHVAIHFALGNESEQNSKFLALYALKTLDLQSPIKMLARNIHTENIRAERQEGTFSYFSHPCSFFLQNRAFPSLNYFSQRYKNRLDTCRFE